MKTATNWYFAMDVSCVSIRPVMEYRVFRKALGFVDGAKLVQSQRRPAHFVQILEVLWKRLSRFLNTLLYLLVMGFAGVTWVALFGFLKLHLEILNWWSQWWGWTAFLKLDAASCVAYAGVATVPRFSAIIRNAKLHFMSLAHFRVIWRCAKSWWTRMCA